jgi:hypothetical protein
MSEATNNSELTVGAIRHQFIRGMFGANDESLVIQGAIFDSWLASVKAEAWDKGQASGKRHPYITEPNPWRGKQA